MVDNSHRLEYPTNMARQLAKGNHLRGASHRNATRRDTARCVATLHHATRLVATLRNASHHSAPRRLTTQRNVLTLEKRK